MKTTPSYVLAYNPPSVFLTTALTMLFVVLGGLAVIMWGAPESKNIGFCLLLASAAVPWIFYPELEKCRSQYDLKFVNELSSQERRALPEMVEVGHLPSRLLSLITTKR